MSLARPYARPPPTNDKSGMPMCMTMTKTKKHPKPYEIKRKLLETLEGYIEASLCKTLDNFTRGE